MQPPHGPHGPQGPPGQVPPASPWGQAPYAPPPYAPPPYPPPYAPPPAWPSAERSWAASGDVAYGPTEDTRRLAAKSPNEVFWVEVLCTSLLGLPGIGTIMVGDVTMGVLLLLFYPTIVWGGILLLAIFTCGIGFFLVPLAVPLNVIVGVLLGHRCKQRVLDAQRLLGMPV